MHLVRVQKASVNKKTGRVHCRITIPSDMVDEMGLKPGDDLFVSSDLSVGGSPRYFVTKVQDDEDASFLTQEDDKQVFARDCERGFLESE